ncbi:pyridoxamine 5'-phosphate oxidase family protein [Jeongeupia wiesaeckerbachi]|uniref:pyridoxamine 5'-phosphate oxidase family protein n=1 Tax=Jeongeupia wiesaeckerbachi TaxID=3051218 RepID=UPI003D800CFC
MKGHAMPADAQFDIRNTAALEALFDAPAAASLAKELDHVDDFYRQWIAASPFVALATVGAGGLDCSPRGDSAGFVDVIDATTLILPERRGNNRIDSLRNLIADPRIALLFLIPGLGETLRINGRARISADPALLERYAVGGKPPKVVLVITVEAVFFQCSRAVVRAGLWDAARHIDRHSLPTPGQILQRASESAIDGAAYDAALPGRIRDTLY